GCALRRSGNSQAVLQGALQVRLLFPELGRIERHRSIRECVRGPESRQREGVARRQLQGYQPGDAQQAVRSLLPGEGEFNLRAGGFVEALQAILKALRSATTWCQEL